MISFQSLDLCGNIIQLLSIFLELPLSHELQ